LALNILAMGQWLPPQSERGKRTEKNFGFVGGGGEMAVTKNKNT